MKLLQEIVAHKRLETAKRKREISPSALAEMKLYGRTTTSLRRSIIDNSPMGIIAEFKRSSPSAGVIKNDLSLEQTVLAYTANGAAGISVLTDKQFFGGSLDDLLSARHKTPLPILMKEFVIDAYQIAEARAYGADAVLLIASILNGNQLREFFNAAAELKLECLVEIHNRHDLEKLEGSRFPLVGINNRDLDTLKIDLHTSLSLSAEIDPAATIISESGLTSVQEIRALSAARIRGVLIGEFFLKSNDPGDSLRTLRKELTLAT